MAHTDYTLTPEDLEIADDGKSVTINNSKLSQRLEELTKEAELKAPAGKSPCIIIDL
jgi:hypothetical protein